MLPTPPIGTTNISAKRSPTNFTGAAMADLFADTAGWAAFLVRGERFHAQAVAAVRQARKDGRRLVTTNLVPGELVALLTSPLRVTRPRQIHFLKTIRQAAWVEVVPSDPAVEAAAWQLWEARPDKEWSWVDCVSFVLMTQRGLMDALTTDHHFEQAGLVRLLK
jgi:uncharacterized protein